MIIRTMPSDLSDVARLAYRVAADNRGYISGDQWGTKQFVRGRHVTLDIAALDELVAAGIGQASTYKGQEGLPGLRITRVHPLYSNLTNGAPASAYDMFTEVFYYEERTGREYLLLTLAGGSVDKKDAVGEYRMPTWSVNLRHTSATDVEHDRAFLAKLDLENPIFTDVSALGTTMVGRLTSILYHPRGFDYMADAEDCAYHRCQEDGRVHPIIEWLPEENEQQQELLGSLIKVKATVRRLVDENGEFIHPAE